MDYFPIFLKLTDEPVVVVGGGHVAARKIALLARAGARITVVAPEIVPELEAARAEGRITHIEAEFAPEHLEGARLAIAATQRRAVNAWVARQAETRNIPVNVVDDRELSRFIVPAIVDRSPIVAAVASSGDAPVLTRRLRERLESLLPQRLGALARLAGALRSTIKRRLASPAARRRFWESFIDGPIAADVLSGRADAEVETHAAAVDAAVARLSQPKAVEGEVVLVGAGPGDPGLLTLRGLRALQNADVILYDRLVSEEVLDLARRDAERIYVGKAAGAAHLSQEGINELMIELALAGKRVCRLKGGDPFIFGRGGEELEALAARGIRFEVVPGVTAASGCAAYAGIPLTHRAHAQALTFVTGHYEGDISKGEAAKLDYELLARPGQTVVFYMGLGRLENILRDLEAHGVPSDRAAAVVENGTRSNQRVVTGTIATLAAKVTESEISSPALLIVGEVVRLHDILHWFNDSTANGNLWLLETSSSTGTSSGRLTA
jgi:uroporphyrin-III C-methyltransferase/precorrin-2 dehydrogenase/sirohydrochlorin ferrochelatase